eukprot:8887015-Karenia_brevis.AAC.1
MAQEAVSKVVHNPSLLSRYGGRSFMLTIAVRQQFTSPLNIALESWQDHTLAKQGGEAPITLRSA